MDTAFGFRSIASFFQWKVNSLIWSKEPETKQNRKTIKKRNELNEKLKVMANVANTDGAQKNSKVWELKGKVLLTVTCKIVFKIKTVQKATTQTKRSSTNQKNINILFPEFQINRYLLFTSLVWQMTSTVCGNGS